MEDFLKNTSHKEGGVAKAIEEQTAKLPSDLLLWAALGSMAISLSLKLARKDNKSLFVGQWAAPFLLLGLYNKLVSLKDMIKKTNRCSLKKWLKLYEPQPFYALVIPVKYSSLC